MKPSDYMTDKELKAWKRRLEHWLEFATIIQKYAIAQTLDGKQPIGKVIDHLAYIMGKDEPK